MSKKDIKPGQKYNMLTVIEYAYSKNNRKYWKCQCDCGNTTIISTNKLGITKSCGCLLHKSKVVDASNNIYGFMQVIKMTGKDKNNKSLCLCRCLRCNKEKEVRLNDLQQGKIVSCGCYGAEKRLEGQKNKLIEYKPHSKMELWMFKF